MKLFTKIAAGVLLGFSALSASAGTLDISVDGIDSWEFEDDALNTILSVPVIDPTTIIGIGWDVTITSIGASWTEEATVGFGPAGAPSDLFLSPCIGEPGSQTGGATTSCSSGGIIDLTMIPDGFGGDLSFTITGGILELEFFETGFNDNLAAIDATWEGTLTIECDGDCVAGPMPTPEPGILVLLGLGLVGVVAARRRS